MSVDLIVNGISNGASVAMLATAFYLVYCIARTFHIALAACYALAPFLYWVAHERGFGVGMSVGASALVAALISVLCESGNHAWLRRKGASPEGHLLSSLGIYIVLVQAMLILWGPDVRLLRTGLEPTYSVVGVEMRWTELVTIGTAALLLAPLWGALRWSRWGIALRALRDSPVELTLLGFNDNRIRALLFALAGAYAAIASLMASLDGGFQAHYGFPNLLLAVVATLSIRGEDVGVAIVGGIVLGVLRMLCVWSLGARWQDTLSYALFAVALVLQSRWRTGKEQRAIV
jgi:branched-subunit amino acid ABC-type transport system permease component